MKTLTLAFMAICSFTCCSHAQQQFQWLVGKWKLEGKELYEIWTEENDGVTLKGISFTIDNGDTLILEKIKLEKVDDAYYYIPDVAENTAPIKFKITAFDEYSFTAENPQHDFPKIIKYTIVRKANSELLQASISGNGKVIPYTFLKSK